MKVADEGTGPRHMLEDRLVHCGDQLRLLVTPHRNGFWVWARYEASVGLINGRPGIMARLITDFGIVLMTDNTVVRWPTPEERGQR